MSRKAGTPNKPKVTSHPMGELDTVDEPREVATKYENPIEGVLLSTNDIVKDYVILENNKWYDLEKQVKGLLDNGAEWVCQGGVSVTNYRGLDGKIVMVYCQALVRKE
jgi:hypothetical protein